MLDVLIIAGLLFLWVAAGELLHFLVRWTIAKRRWAVREFVGGPLDGMQLRLPRHANFFSYFEPADSSDAIVPVYLYWLRKGRFVLQRTDRPREPRSRPEDEEEIPTPSSP